MFLILRRLSEFYLLIGYFINIDYLLVTYSVFVVRKLKGETLIYRQKFVFFITITLCVILHFLQDMLQKGKRTYTNNNYLTLQV